MLYEVITDSARHKLNQEDHCIVVNVDPERVAGEGQGDMRFLQMTGCALQKVCRQNVLTRPESYNFV